MITRDLTEQELISYKNDLIQEYSFELINAGYTKEDAAKQLGDDFDRLIKLPGKMLVAQDELGNDIGRMWFCVRELMGETMGFILEVQVFENCRGKGYGRKLMKFIESEVKNMGVDKLGLNVFKDNESAVSLYKSEGYIIKENYNVNLFMIKNI